MIVLKWFVWELMKTLLQGFSCDMNGKNSVNVIHNYLPFLPVLYLTPGMLKQVQIHSNFLPDMYTSIFDFDAKSARISSNHVNIETYNTIIQ